MSQGSRPRQALLVGFGLGVLVLAAFVASLSLGVVAVAPWDALGIVAASLGVPWPHGASDAQARIVLALRLPRTLAAAIVGALLAHAGVLLQSVTRSRVMEPATIGASAGALLGTSLALAAAGATQRVHLVAADTLGNLALAFTFAVAGALAAVGLALRSIPSAWAGASGQLLVVGMGVNAVVGSLAALVLFVAPIGAQTAATVVLSWAFGARLANATMPLVLAALVAWTLVVVTSWVIARDLDAWAIGADEAATSGVNTRRLIVLAVVAACVATGAAVAVAGIVVFVGLLGPQAARRLVGPHHRFAVPAAAAIGAALVMTLDVLGRVWIQPAEVPLGVLAALVGAPLLWYVVAQPRGGASA